MFIGNKQWTNSDKQIAQSLRNRLKGGFDVQHGAGQETIFRLVPAGDPTGTDGGDCHPETRYSAQGPRHDCKYARRMADVSPPKRERKISPVLS